MTQLELEAEAAQICRSMEQSVSRRVYMRWAAPLAAMAAIGGAAAIYRGLQARNNTLLVRGFQIQAAGLVTIALINWWKEMPANGVKSHLESVKKKLKDNHQVQSWEHIAQLPELWEKCRPPPEQIPVDQTLRLLVPAKKRWKERSRLSLAAFALMGVVSLLWLASRRRVDLALSLGAGGTLTSFIVYLAIGNEREQVTSQVRRKQKIATESSYTGWSKKRRVGPSDFVPSFVREVVVSAELTDASHLPARLKKLTAPRVSADLSRFNRLREVVIDQPFQALETLPLNKLHIRQGEAHHLPTSLQELTVRNFAPTEGLVALRYLKKVHLTDPRANFWKGIVLLPAIETVIVDHSRCFSAANSLQWLKEASSLKELEIKAGFTTCPARDFAFLHDSGFTVFLVDDKEVTEAKAANHDALKIRRTRQTRIL